MLLLGLLFRSVFPMAKRSEHYLDRGEALARPPQDEEHEDEGEEGGGSRSSDEGKLGKGSGEIALHVVERSWGEKLFLREDFRIEDEVEDESPFSLDEDALFSRRDCLVSAELLRCEEIAAWLEVERVLAVCREKPLAWGGVHLHHCPNNRVEGEVVDRAVEERSLA